MGYQLLIDTSSNQLAIGIADDYEVVYKIQYPALQKQSELATVEINKALKKLDIDVSELKRIIVTKGPGSYTGVRVGLTIAKIMSYVHSIPVCAISTLQALVGMEPKAIAVLDAKSDKAYIGVYNYGKVKTKETIEEVSSLDELLEKFEGYKIYGDKSLIKQLDTPIDLIENMFQISKIEKNEKYVDTLVPTYLKD
jgi:tRNA threonylcarbamoyl adenosine modification protein YeaZ